MLSRRANATLRLGAGLSLLLLLIAQAKACPSLYAPVTAATQGESEPSSGAPKPKKQRPTISIYHALPALPDSRRASKCCHDGQQWSAACSGRANVTAQSPRDPLQSVQTALREEPWRLPAIGAVQSAATPAARDVVLGARLAGDIQRTGPPAR